MCRAETFACLVGWLHEPRDDGTTQMQRVLLILDCILHGVRYTVYAENLNLRRPPPHDCLPLLLSMTICRGFGPDPEPRATATPPDGPSCRCTHASPSVTSVHGAFKRIALISGASRCLGDATSRLGVEAGDVGAEAGVGRDPWSSHALPSLIACASAG